MPRNISLKNVPDDLVEKLKRRARKNRRSMQGELLFLLEKALRQEKLDLEVASSELDGLGLKTPEESEWIIRELRDGQ